MRSWFQHPVCQWGLSTIQGGCRGHGMRITCCSSLRLSSSQMPKVPFANSTDTRALPRAAGVPSAPHQVFRCRRGKVYPPYRALHPST